MGQVGKHEAKDGEEEDLQVIIPFTVSQFRRRSMP